jgi:formylglycine-generating enzyme required for sulfatase activity
MPASAANAPQKPVTAESGLTSLRLAIEDLTTTFGARYQQGRAFAERLSELERREAASGQTPDFRDALAQLRREALLANPLLDFERLLLVQRDGNNLGLPQNWEGNSSLPRDGFNNQIAVLSPIRPDGELRPLFRPEGGRFVGDVDLDFSGRRLLLSMPGEDRRWQVFEINADGSGLRQLPLIGAPDVDNYDACYLPDGDIMFGSTAPFTGVPCVTGSSHVANLFRLHRQTGEIRRLTFDQDHNWCPTVLNDGRLLYLRWEYSDIPHFVARILFHANPDGTDQKEFYGSSSYWPNAMFYARPVPGSATKFVAVVGGHHGLPRMGELVLFDTAKGRCEAEGALQRIPGRGRKVEPIILDELTDASWPKFLHPWPLSEKYFLVSAKLTPASKWGIYLADVFDNLVLLKEGPDGSALLEPIPFRATVPPPVIPDKVQPGRHDALVYLADVYSGPGLAGVPRGTVKQLRLFTYHFAYHGMGGQVNRVGLDGPWDIKRIMGSVPVEADGSAFFRVPANTPISVQPLDADGQALQLMRSWMTAMPGETLSCVGCHDRQNSTPMTGAKSLALAKVPAEITPWHGPTRGFSFVREVQPMLDRHCVACHSGQARADGKTIPDFRAAPPVHPPCANPAYREGTQFSPSYLALRGYVRGHTIESDMHLLTPGEYHAGTTELVQMLRRGHQGVKLDAEAWDRLITWIDLNTPAHGTWQEIVGAEKVTNQRDRRRELLRLYAGIDEDPEVISPEPQSATSALGAPTSGPAQTPSGHGLAGPEAGAPPAPAFANPAGWPFDAAEARRRQATPGDWQRQVELTNGLVLKLVLIPAGEFVTGGDSPVAAKISAPFWIGQFEISNEQFAKFDPAHDSRIERGDFLQFSVRERGYPANEPRQPVVRVSWQEAMDFCRWLSAKTGETFSLPTEEQWEYACRAGTATPLWIGGLQADFSPAANLADRTFRFMPTLGWSLPSDAVPPYRPAVQTVDDHFRVTAPVGSFQPNPWELARHARQRRRVDAHRRCRRKGGSRWLLPRPPRTRHLGRASELSELAESI